jgi:cobalt-zinc-cadmium efflux system membrane fusion protein
MVIITLIALVGVFAVFVLDIPLPWKNRASAESLPAARTMQAIELVKGMPHTVQVPEAVRRSLGIRRGDRDIMASPRELKDEMDWQPMVLPGSTALDPAKIVRIRARFAPAEVKTVFGNPRLSDSQAHPWRPGDEVKKNDELALFYSVEVGNKKNDLFEAIIQLRLDEVILDKAEKAGGALPDIYLWNARRNVDADRSAVTRAKNTLKTWNIDDEDIKEVEAAAQALSLTEGRRDHSKETAAVEKAKQEKWARVVLKAPCDGVLVERNISQGETIVDNTLNLLTIAQVDRLAVLVNIHEDDLDRVQDLTPDQQKWKIKTVGARWAKKAAQADNHETAELPGTIDEIGYFIDQSQHTGLLKGYIDNPTNKQGMHVMRAGQFVTATILLPPPKGVVEIPLSSLVEDGKQSLVFVQTDPSKHYYTLRRVVVVQRFDKTAYIQSTPIPEKERLTDDEKKQGLLPREPLGVNDRLLTSGVLELKAALLEKEARENRAK